MLSFRMWSAAVRGGSPVSRSSESPMEDRWPAVGAWCPKGEPADPDLRSNDFAGDGVGARRGAMAAPSLAPPAGEAGGPLLVALPVDDPTAPTHAAPLLVLPALFWSPAPRWLPGVSSSPEDDESASGRRQAPSPNPWAALILSWTSASVSTFAKIFFATLPSNSEWPFLLNSWSILPSKMWFENKYSFDPSSSTRSMSSSQPLLDGCSIKNMDRRTPCSSGNSHGLIPIDDGACP
mmetsp:Transcript_18048/g.51308  ORF Transcript_18048/g.51308 Transcript_18048/m.51308 type:complete len:236 (+) Transcript_18048:2371-3078(+)